MGRRGRARSGALVALVGVAVVALGLPPAAAGPSPAVASPAGSVPGAGGPRPRAVLTPGSEATLAARLTREPYRTVFLDAHALHSARRAARAPDDQTIAGQKDLARAARWFAFEYAIDRTVIDGAIVPFPDAGARTAVADDVASLLEAANDRSRLALAPPLGGWDRDLDSAGEIVQWSGAFDTLLGAGYDFGGRDGAIAARLVEHTAELYRNYVTPATAGGYADLHQNNHRTRTGVALATAAVVLAEYAPAADPDGSRDPLAWWELGITLVDDVLRHVLVTGDGAYAEGPHYYRFTTQVVAPYVGMWERLLGAASYTTTSGRVVPALAHTPQFARTQDWMVAVSLPDGTVAPFDDTNTDESQYFGALPPLPNRDAYAWRWTTGRFPLATEGSVDLAVDTIVAYDDAVTPAPPERPTSFWPDGGQAVFRSDWSEDATLVIAQGEGITASEFGRDATGRGRFPQSHDHIDPGSFLLHAYGERLLLDPGYLSFGTHAAVLAPSDHNMVLVDGEGPTDLLGSSFAWGIDPLATPDQDGFATLHRTIDSGVADAATVTARYGGRRAGTDVTVERRFLFVDDAYLVVADRVAPDLDPAHAPVDLTWALHGNGGGDSGGDFTTRPDGGRWTYGAARVDSVVTTDHGAPVLTTRLDAHEAEHGRERTHVALDATIPTRDPVRAVQVLYPTPVSRAAPVVATAGARTTVADAAGDRDVTATLGAGGVEIVDRRSDGSVRLAWAESTSVLGPPGAPVVRTVHPGALGIRPGPDRTEIVADGPGRALSVQGLGFVPRAADGACRLRTDDGVTRIGRSDSPTVVLRADAGNSAPGARAGAGYRRAAVGSRVVLDGSGSCDLDHDRLTPHWSLVAAPRGSAWSLRDPESWTPALDADATGTFRVQLVVTDAHGVASEPVTVEIAAGSRCFDERDDDLDGRFDQADPDCDGPEPGPALDVVALSTGADGFGSALAGPHAVRVRRDLRLAPARVTASIREGRRAITIDVRRRGTSWTGRVAARDPDSGRAINRRWSGTVDEIAPGVLVGTTPGDPLVFLLVDRP